MKKLLLSLFLLCSFLIHAQSGENSVQLLSLETNPIVKSGSETISGVLENIGSNAVNSMEINWQIDNGSVSTQTLSNLNIAPGTSYAFTHESIWNAIPGDYNLRVWVSAVNNLSADVEVIQNVKVASNTTIKYPLYEKFTSSTCGPCAYYNNVTYNAHYNARNEEFVNINYQMNWPGAGDPYYTAEGGVRRAYYGVNGVPTLLINKFAMPYPGSTQHLNNFLDSQIGHEGFFELEADFEVNEDEISIDVSVMPFVSGTYRLHVVVIENLTTGNVATNGETSFKNVMMKMVPDAQGTSVDFVQDELYETSFTLDLSTTNVEEMDDLDVIVFIQQYATKDLMQATSVMFPPVYHLSVGEETMTNVTLYPNPSTGFIRINSDNPVDIQLYDVTGKLVFSQNQVTKNSELNLSFLQKGLYIAKMASNDARLTQKIILK